MELLKKSLEQKKITLRNRNKVAIAILAIVFFLFVPFIGASSLGPVQLPCYFAGACKPGYAHFTISLSCYVSGDSLQMFLGDSYYDGQLSVGCGGPLLV
jgi:hypothetical protein